MYDESLDYLFRKHADPQLKNIKILSKDVYSANVSIEATDDFVRVDLIGAKQVVIIESVEFALAFKQIFELAWKNFPDTKTVSQVLANKDK